MIKAKCLKCKYWVRYFNSNNCFCKRGYCITISARGHKDRRSY